MISGHVNRTELEASTLWRAYRSAAACAERGRLSEVDDRMRTVRMIGELTEIATVARAAGRIMETLVRLRREGGT